MCVCLPSSAAAAAAAVRHSHSSIHAVVSQSTNKLQYDCITLLEQAQRQTMRGARRSSSNSAHRSSSSSAPAAAAAVAAALVELVNAVHVIVQLRRWCSRYSFSIMCSSRRHRNRSLPRPRLWRQPEAIRYHDRRRTQCHLTLERRSTKPSRTQYWPMRLVSRRFL